MPAIFSIVIVSFPNLFIRLMQVDKNIADNKNGIHKPIE